jgi:FkbM family methyltransferase
VFLEHRLPEQAKRASERLASGIDLRHKTMRAGDLRVTVRRMTDDEGYVRSILKGGQYNPPGYEVGETDTVVDVGGNIGTFALLAAERARRGRVITIEPVAENFALVQQNIAQNGLTNITPIRAAVLDRPGEIAIRLHPEATRTGTHSVQEFWLAQAQSDRSEVVPVVTLPAVFDEHKIERCDFLKLDCEGPEYTILSNLPREYFRRIRQIVREYHCGTTETQAKRAQADALVEHLEKAGYRIDAYIGLVGFRAGFIRVRRADAD